MDLEFLDISWNFIQALGETFFSFLPYLKTFKVKNNEIISLPEDHWKMAPRALRMIDLTDNPLRCDCDMKWINTTFDVKLIILGRCDSPKEYKGSYLRKRINLLAKMCDEEGKIGTLKPLTKKSVTW